jgi:hypothetical protein
LNGLRNGLHAASKAIAVPVTARMRIRECRILPPGGWDSFGTAERPVPVSFGM